MANDIKSIFDLDQFKHLRDPFEARKQRFIANWRYYKADYKNTD